jgi:hypothetical protein
MLKKTSFVKIGKKSGNTMIGKKGGYMQSKSVLEQTPIKEKSTKSMIEKN